MSHRTRRAAAAHAARQPHRADGPAIHARRLGGADEPRWRRLSRRRIDLALEGPLVAWGFGLNLAWELVQTPLYEDSAGGPGYLAWSRLHCTLGDVLILLGAFWTSALACRSRRWAATSRLLGPLTFVAAGLGYTVWSEWVNVSLRSAWAYRPEMPTVVGIGVAPLLQWVVVPLGLVALLRRSARRRRGRRSGADRGKERRHG